MTTIKYISCLLVATLAAVTSYAYAQDNQTMAQQHQQQAERMAQQQQADEVTPDTAKPTKQDRKSTRLNSSHVT